VARQREHARGWAFVHQLRRRGKTIEAGHGNIHDDDVGRDLLGLSYRFTAIAGGGDDLHVGLCVQNHSQALADGFVIVGEEDAEFGGHMGLHP
jgi:hypothetical protein